MPFAFVVKNGSNACARVASSMPTPVSVIGEHARTDPARAPRPSAASRSSVSSTFAVSIVTSPPAGIASRAFSTRLTITCSIWLASALHEAEPGSEPRVGLDVLADQPREHVQQPRDALVDVR